MATLAFPTDDQEAVTNFMNRNRYPLIETVTFDTYNDMMSKDDAALVVLAAMRSDVAGKEDLAEFEKMARAFRHGARSQYKPVRFVVSDSILRPKMKLWFDMKADDLPRFVVVDPVQKVYYKGTVEGKEVAFNGEDAFSVVEAVWQGWARPIPIRTSLRVSPRKRQENSRLTLPRASRARASQRSSHLSFSASSPTASSGGTATAVSSAPPCLGDTSTRRASAASLLVWIKWRQLTQPTHSCSQLLAVTAFAD